MALALFLSLVLTPSLQGNRLGKTDVQILAMGHEGWVKFYVSRNGDTMLDQRWANGYYQKALAGKITRQISRLTSKDRRRLTSLRRDLQGLSEALIVGDAEDKYGQDRWLFATISVDSILDDLSRKRYGKSPVASTDQIARDLTTLRDKAKFNPESVEMSLGQIDKARTIYRRMARTLAGSPARERHAILWFTRQMIFNA